MRTLKIALAGNPNSGKTTVFNELTASRQHVGNWPGVTVQKKEGRFVLDGVEVRVVDLPGTYSLSTYSLDEKVARDFLAKESPDLVVAVVDASNLERNLYLVTQLLELGVPVLIDLNMMDQAEEKGIRIDADRLSRVLDVMVVKTAANKGRGIAELKKAILEASGRTGRKDFRIDYGRDIEREIEALSDLADGTIPAEGLSVRWMVVKLLEGDTELLQRVRAQGRGGDFEASLKRSRQKLEKHIGYDLETAIVERRYGFLEGLVRECVEAEWGVGKRHALSDQIDVVVTNKVVGIPIFLLLMWLLFETVFAVGNPLAGLIGSLFGWIGSLASSAVQAAHAPLWLGSLIEQGVIGGVGSVVVFLPNILLLFLAIALLEDSGYLARAAFVMDRLMHALGLHGKSFIPMLLGFGCGVPAIMATRGLESRKDRILTTLVIPLMSCSARLPIYVLFAAVFFPGKQGLVVFSIYLLGIVLAVVVARVFGSIFFKHETAPLIMELPPYRAPQLRGILIHMWERGSVFLRKAGTVILVGVIVIWFLASFPPGAEYASRESLIGSLGALIAPVLSWTGAGFWQAAVALLSGILAKELVVGTLGTLFGAAGLGLKDALVQHFTPGAAYAFMVMSLIYVPCLPVIAVIRKEIGGRWALLTVVYSLILGWGMAVGFYQLAKLF